MPRKPRIIIPEYGDLVEVTTRTIQGRRLLRPSPDLNEIVLGVLGRALTLPVDVGLCGFTFLSNHYVMLLRTLNSKHLSTFMSHVNGNLAREVGRLHQWPEKFWGRRFSGIQVIDEPSSIDRMKYVLAHGAKEGLVDSPRDWPGVHCLPSLLEGKTLRGTWFNRTAEYRARKRGKTFDKYEFATSYEVPLVPLPGWEKLSTQERQARCAQLVADIEEEARQNNRAKDRVPPGPRRVCNVHPHTRPEHIKRSPAPLCHAASRATRKRYRKEFGELDTAFRKAARKQAEDKRPIGDFPPGTFPPAPPFVPYPLSKRIAPRPVTPRSMPP